MTTAFVSGCTGSATLDPFKRVNYVNGLVLGVDEFQQEQHYFVQRNRLHNRSLHGYGIVCGLHVAVEDGDTDGPLVRVKPGLAVGPQGQEVAVRADQCAQLNAWLRRHASEMAPGSPPSLRLHVVLCPRECLTDYVPIPGSPCRSLDESAAASRIAEDFELALRLERPQQVEEDTVRAFGDLLQSLEITDEAGGQFLTQEQLNDVVRTLRPGSPAGPAFPETGSPPVPVRRVPAASAADYLRAAFHVWVTEVRPNLLSDGVNCVSGPSERCVLLAELEVPLEPAGSGWQVSGNAAAVTLDTKRVPHLLQTRVLQEWLLSQTGWSDQFDTFTFADLALINPSTIRAWIHFPHLLTIPETAVSVEVDGTAVAFQLTNVPGLNLVDLELTGDPLANGSRVCVRFASTQIVEAGSPGESLATLLDAEAQTYLDRDGDDLLAYLSVFLPALDDLTDVTVISPQDHQVLKYTASPDASRAASQWVNDWLVLNELGDVEADSPNSGDTLVWDDSQDRWVPGFPQHDLGDHADALISNPSPGHVLRFRNTPQGRRWVNEPLSVQPEGDIIETELTRIVALSWRHGQPSDFVLQFANPVDHPFGVAFAVGRGDIGQHEPILDFRTINEHTFQLFFETQRAPQSIEGVITQRFLPARFAPIVPLQISAQGRIVELEEVRPEDASGAALLMTREDRAQFMEIMDAILRIWVVIKGDFILDRLGRALDAEHVHGQLPTGAGPPGRKFGIRGGLFESWIATRDIRPIELNIATRDELMRLPGIGAARADEIIRRREELGGFRSFEDLSDALPENVRETLRNRVIIGRRPQ